MDAVGADKVQPIVTNLEIPELPSGELNQKIGRHHTRTLPSRECNNRR